MSRRRIAAIGVVAAAMLALAAWRWVPRPPIPPTAAMRQAAHVLVSRARAVTTPAPQPPQHPKTARERLIAGAFTLRGKPYRWGAKGPDAYDCSGFTKAAYAKIGVRLPDGSFNQAKGERALGETALLKPGDLLLYRWAGSDAVKHVTIYAGDGWVIGTGSPGQPAEVTLYPLADDLVGDGRVITYRHVVLPDES